MVTGPDGAAQCRPDSHERPAMSYPVHIYVGPNGTWCGARNPPPGYISIGLWEPSQFRYRPFIEALNEGVDAARNGQAPVRRGKYSHEQFKHLPVALDRRAKQELRMAAELHLVDGYSISASVRMVGIRRRSLQRALKSMYARLSGEGRFPNDYRHA